MEASLIYFSRKQRPTANRRRFRSPIGQNALFADNTNLMQHEFLWNFLGSRLAKVLLAASYHPRVLVAF
jgi:hypothetical protein